MGQDDEDDAQMLQAKQQITFNVVNKRKDQLRRWQSSEMNREAARRMKRPKVQFQDSDIFLSACMSGDEEEVEELLSKGADINTCTVDGLTALHQSVIDSKPEMVRFLCSKGADVNAQDNEGWTPLHAAACCGNVAIVRYLCQHGADLSVVNSDKELALDLAVDEQCREYLEDDYRRNRINLEECREQELHLMLKDVKMWMSQGEYRDIPHHRTGGTAMHVAAGRGYTQLLELLIKAGGNVRSQDKEGWTPLHAAAHWAERDACKILLENGAELSDLTYTGIDVLGVADKDCVDYLVELADTVKSQNKRKSPGGSLPPASVLQEKNHRMSTTTTHEEHVLSTERKRDLQHKDQHSENEYLHSIPSTTSIGSTVSTSSSNNMNNLSNTSTSTTTIVIDDVVKDSEVIVKDSEDVVVAASEEEEEKAEVQEEVTAEEKDVEEEDEDVEEEDEESEILKETGRSASESRSLSVTRSLDGYTDRSSSGRETSVDTSEAASLVSHTTASSAASGSGSSGSSSRFTSSSTPLSQRSASVQQQETPRSSLENTSSIGSGDQTVSATVPIAPLTAPPPKAVHQSPSSWINRGVPLSSRSSTSSVTRSSSTPVSEIISPPASLHSQHSFPSSSLTNTSTATVTPTPSSIPSTPVNSNVMAATISSSAKNTPSPAGSVTISATFSKPSSRNPSEELYRSPSQPTNVPWASLWHNVNNASTGHIRSHIEQLRNASSSSLSTYYPPRVSAFRPPTVRPSASSASVNSTTSSATYPHSPVIAEYPRGFVPQQINPNKMSRWQSKTVTESEAERRNNSRMQRQHRRSTQGVTKEQLEEASKFATDEVARRNSQVLSTYPNTLQARLASEEKDLSSTSDDPNLTTGGDVTTSATVSLVNSPNSTSSSVRRKSQGLTISRSNRRATGPVNPEDLAPAMSLRLASAAPQPYSIRANTGTMPLISSSRYVMEKTVAEKAQSLPPGGMTQTPTATQSTTQSLSSRSAVVAGLSPAPTMRTPGAPLISNTTTSSRFMPSSSLSSNGSSVTNPPVSAYGLQTRPTETNLNYKALFEKERTECDRLRREMDDLRRSQTNDTWRGASTQPAWRTRNASPSAQPHNLSVAKSTSLASFDENERRSMERKIADLELQLKTTQNLRMENQRLKEENGALVRVISKMTI
ncbi:CRE-MEL-11 protein [Caenorhabditis remanei]|uniref:CRE-MEL-11 protein n=1 Tax=Caenorhabditis remanei TaxID=31234 RepID=E3NIT1_CAERE|nr:CRE-MEL-11 protein [Caenorhabditis remanei]